jgi:hypothetical protein
LPRKMPEWWNWAYTDASKASVRKDMRVRVPLPAPTRDEVVKTVGAICDNELMYPPATVELASSYLTSEH